MKNIVYIKKLNIQSIFCNCEFCNYNVLISANNIDFMVTPSDQCGKLFEGRKYNFLLDITAPYTPADIDIVTYEHEPILAELNEYYDFLMAGIMSNQDFDTLLEDKVGVFTCNADHKYHYKIIGQVQHTYLNAKGVYFYIGENFTEINNKFVIAYSKYIWLCDLIAENYHILNNQL